MVKRNLGGEKREEESEDRSGGGIQKGISDCILQGLRLTQSGFVQAPGPFHDAGTNTA